MTKVFSVKPSTDPRPFESRKLVDNRLRLVNRPVYIGTTKGKSGVTNRQILTRELRREIIGDLRKKH